MTMQGEGIAQGETRERDDTADWGGTVDRCGKIMRVRVVAGTYGSSVDIYCTGSR